MPGVVLKLKAWSSCWIYFSISP